MALASYDVEGVRPQPVLLYQPSLLAAPRHRRVQRVEHGRVVVQRLPEPRQERRGAARVVHDALDEHVRPHLGDVREHRVPRARHVEADALLHQRAEAEEVVDDECLVSGGGVSSLDEHLLPVLLHDHIELERRQAGLTGADAELPPCLLDLPGVAGSGRTRVANGGQPPEQSRPSEPVVEAVVHDVQLLLPRGGVEDGLDDEYQRHPAEAAGGHVQPVRPEALGDGGPLRHGQTPELPADAQQPRVQPLGEPLRGVPGRRRVQLDLQQQQARAPVVVLVHLARAADQQPTQIHPIVSPPHLLLATALFAVGVHLVLVRFAVHGYAQLLHVLHPCLVSTQHDFIHGLMGGSAHL
ncbi:hypothetical protein U9M48_001019 [Paspalum notatum var. saurae]|uniref:Uncharacterized protein n=1 Tax=Paspalum notatum var. saurae TaxID=547442 RepID=A0AAQ3SGC8_PASNO